jgi:hypothetical protein
LNLASKSFRLFPGVASLFGWGPLLVATVIYLAIGCLHGGHLLGHLQGATYAQ